MKTNSLMGHSVSIILIVSIMGGIVMAAPVPSEIKSVVAFIFITNVEGKLIPNGTGFFVGVKNPSTPNSFSVYLVTAKHVLYKPQTTDFFDKVFVRLNKKEGGSQIGSIPLIATGDQRNVFSTENIGDVVD